MGDSLSKTIPATPRAMRLSPFRGTILKGLNPSEAYAKSEQMLRTHLDEVKRRDRTLAAAEPATEDLMDAVKVVAARGGDPEIISQVIKCTDRADLRESAVETLKKVG